MEITKQPFSDVWVSQKLYIIDMINLLLVEDDASLRTGIRMRLALEADMHIIGETGDGQEALQLARALQPDVILMDVRLPGLDGLEATRLLRESVPRCSVVILTLYDEAANRQRAREMGAFAFVSKQESDDTLMRAIRSAANLPR
jgi:DNA-binding NarL/FixJ family response regulator